MKIKSCSQKCSYLPNEYCPVNSSKAGESKWKIWARYRRAVTRSASTAINLLEEVKRKTDEAGTTKAKILTCPANFENLFLAQRDLGRPFIDFGTEHFLKLVQRRLGFEAGTIDILTQDVQVEGPVFFSSKGLPRAHLVPSGQKQTGGVKMTRHHNS